MLPNFMIDTDNHIFGGGTSHSFKLFDNTFNDKYILGILNSKLGWWLISKYCTAIQNGYQLIWKYFSQIPIAIGNETVRKNIVVIVNEILLTKKQNPSTDTSDIENQIDQLVYQLYDLTEEEIAIVEGSNK
jgi:hypothetical protein